MDLLQLRVPAIDGRPIEDSLGEHLDRLYASVEQGNAPPYVAVELEKNISIQLATDQLVADMTELQDRFPGIIKQAAQPLSEAAAMRPHKIQRGTTHRWLRHAQAASEPDGAVKLNTAER